MTMEKRKSFDSVAFFRQVKTRMAEKMAGMTLEQQREFLRALKEGRASLDDFTAENPARQGV